MRLSTVCIVLFLLAIRRAIVVGAQVLIDGLIGLNSGGFLATAGAKGLPSCGWEKAVSDYTYLLERLREAEAAVSELEAALSREPRDRALEMDLISARQSAQEFQEALLALAPNELLDVCRYRLVPDRRNDFTIDSVTGSLKGFQELFSLIFYVVSTAQPRRVARIPPAIVTESELNIGWTFAGSLGIVLTIDSARTLFDAKFDNTITKLLNIINIKDQTDVRESAQKLGLAVVRKAYEWANRNYNAGYGVDLRWRNVNMIERGLFIERADFVRIVDNIGLTSDVTKEIITLDGVLAGGDIMTRRFHFVDSQDQDYRGVLSSDFLTEKMELGQKYHARMLVERTLRYAEEEEERSYSLLALETQGSLDGVR
jgi:hypothetical protein